MNTRPGFPLGFSTEHIITCIDWVVNTLVKDFVKKSEPLESGSQGHF